jgi:hypothetical protein
MEQYFLCEFKSPNLFSIRASSYRFAYVFKYITEHRCEETLALKEHRSKQTSFNCNAQFTYRCLFAIDQLQLDR